MGAGGSWGRTSHSDHYYFRKEDAYERYQKKPVVIDAFRFGIDDIPQWFVGQVNIDGFIEIETLEGTMIANHGDWIIKGVKGEIYPCKNDIFQETYIEVEL